MVTVHVGGLSLHKLHSNWGQGIIISTMMQVEMTPLIYVLRRVHTIFHEFF